MKHWWNFEAFVILWSALRLMKLWILLVSEIFAPIFDRGNEIFIIIKGIRVEDGKSFVQWNAWSLTFVISEEHLMAAILCKRYEKLLWYFLKIFLNPKFSFSLIKETFIVKIYSLQRKLKVFELSINININIYTYLYISSIIYLRSLLKLFPFSIKYSSKYTSHC